MHHFKTLLAGSDPIHVFALGRIAHPIIVDMFALAGGYHGFWIDLEHGAISTEQVLIAATAARANGLDSFVRIPPVGYWQVTQLLEAGAGGVMGAQIHSAEHAEQFVRWAKFAPRGVRGLNSGGRDGLYTHRPLPQFIDRANRDQIVLIQIETLGALEEADAIAALDGVDVLFVGPADLSMALGIVGQFHHERLWEAIAAVAAACRRHGKAWGVVPADPKFAQRALDQGCRMITTGSDVLALRWGIDALRAAYGVKSAAPPA